MDCLGDGPWVVKREQGTHIGHFLAVSLFSFSSMTLCSISHITYCLLTTLLNVLQKYVGREPHI